MIGQSALRFKVDGKALTFMHEFLKMLLISEVHSKGKPYA